MLKAGSDPAYDLRQCEGFLKEPYQHLRREVAVGRDGSFCIADVPTGVYDLSIDARGGQVTGDAPTTTTVASASAKPGYQGGALARVRLRFVVPAADAQTSGPLDLGAQEIAIARIMTGRQAAPEFKCVTLDGQEFSLAAQRGKFVLVEFWASWCGFCRAELPAMKRLHQEFGNDPRLVMIGLSVDSHIDQAEAYVAKNGIAWNQGILGNWSYDRVSRRYQVKEIPTMFLIGPDGRIMDKQVSGQAMRESVARALGQ